MVFTSTLYECGLAEPPDYSTDPGMLETDLHTPRQTQLT